MATLGDILKVKQPDIWAQLAGQDPSVTTPGPSVPDAAPSAPAPAAPSAPASLAMQGPDTADLERSEAAAKLAADNAHSSQMLREGAALARLVGHNQYIAPDLSDLEAARKAPLEAYARRQQARQEANKAILDQLTGAHTQAQTAHIPIEEQQAAGRLAEETRQHNLEQTEKTEQRRSAESINKNTQEHEDYRARLRVAVEKETAGKFSVATDPITGEQRIFDVHTGTFQGAPLSTATPEEKENYRRKKVLTPQENKDLDTGEQAGGDINSAQEAVTAHPGAFNRAANLAETVVGKVPLVGQALAPGAGAALRSPEEQQARMSALTAAASRIHEIAGTRGFSSTERGYMNQLVPGPNDTPEMVLNKLKEAERVNSEHVARIRGKLGPKAGAPHSAPAKVPDMVDAKGVKHSWDGSKWVPSGG